MKAGGAYRRSPAPGLVLWQGGPLQMKISSSGLMGAISLKNRLGTAAHGDQQDAGHGGSEGHRPEAGFSAVAFLHLLDEGR